MSLDEPQPSEIELRDLITERLSKTGLINDIKAQLRAGVLLTLSQEKDSPIPIHDQKKKIQNLANNFEGKLAISLIKDFMKQLDLKHTLSVFELEAGVEELNLSSRDSIIHNYNGIINMEDSKSPLIFGFLRNLDHSNNNNISDAVGKDSPSSGHSKNKRILPLVNDKKDKDHISYKSDGSSDFSDAIIMPDSSGQKNINSQKISNPYQTVSKPSRSANNNEISYDDSDKSSTTKNNDDKSDEDSIKEIDIEEIDERSESRTCDVTIDSERSLSLDYAELAKKKY